MEAFVWAVETRCDKKGETATFWSQSSNKSTKMNPSGTKLSGDKQSPDRISERGLQTESSTKGSIGKQYEIIILTDHNVRYHHCVCD